MIKHYTHYTEGRTCSSSVSFDYEDGIIKNVEFTNGCPGNTQGVATLANGRPAAELIELLKGIQCRGENSCPNELAMGIMECLEEINDD
ncbi:MAG: TSCPD domain-containing protein [Firmicutes bacterium]|nr:TSCPD domain-containing protein [Bacillota bacterium]